jgi:hypothetical protein
LEQNAMKMLSRFVTKFTSLIVTVLSCFDRVIFAVHHVSVALADLPVAEGHRQEPV